ncbi:hypothetical protein PT286_06690 [Neisseriaceae bacterium ESL0693]|nr:hypothetical protein [Neisseriaceae bacterium ESL0693]
MMQHRRRLQIFQAAKRAAFTHQHQFETKPQLHDEEHDKLFMMSDNHKQYQQ